MQVHEHARQFVGVARIVFLLLSGVDETDSEPVTVVGVVTAAAPDPVATQACRAPALTTAARRQFTVATCSRHGVHDSSGRDGVRERCLSTRCITTSQRHHISLTRPPDILVGGLRFLSICFFRLLPSELVERNSTKSGYMLAGKCDLKTHVRIWSIPLQIGGPRYFLRRLRNLTATLTAYIETRYRQSGKCVGNYVYAVSKNFPSLNSL